MNWYSWEARTEHFLTEGIPLDELDVPEAEPLPGDGEAADAGEGLEDAHGVSVARVAV